MSDLNLSDVISGQDDPEEIFEILDLLGISFFKKLFFSKEEVIMEVFIKLYINLPGNWWL